MMRWASVGLAVLTAATVIGTALHFSRTGAAQDVRPDVTIAGKEDKQAAARRYVGKPRPPVRVFLARETRLEAGASNDLGLAIQSGVPMTDLRLVLEGSPGLDVTGVQRVGAGSLLHDAESISQQFDRETEYRVLVNPLSGGLWSISGQLQFETAGVEQAMQFHLPIHVSGPITIALEMPKGPAPVMDNTGELVESMSAEVTRFEFSN